MLKEIFNCSPIKEINEKLPLKKYIKQGYNIDPIDYSTHVYSYNGQLYYIKYVDGLNELIGEYYANKLELPTANYEPVRHKSNIEIASLNFKKCGVTYIPFEEAMNKFNLSYESIFFENKHEQIKDKLYKLIALDIFMRQYDRVSSNLLIQKDSDNNISLAPIFDYSCSLCGKEYNVYNTPYKEFQLCSVEFFNFLKTNTKIIEYLLILLKIDLKDFISFLENKYNVIILEEYKNYYLNNIENSKELVKKIIKN